MYHPSTSHEASSAASALPPRRLPDQPRRSPGCHGASRLLDTCHPDCRGCEFLKTCTGASLKHAERHRPDAPGPIANAELFRSFWLRRSRVSAAKALHRDRERKRETRASLAGKLKEGMKRRERVIARFAHGKIRSKRAEQLRGREREIAVFWLATEVAKMDGSVSDASVASIFSRLPGGFAITRHQSRSRRLLIRDLERPNEPWHQFAAHSHH